MSGQLQEQFTGLFIANLAPRDVAMLGGLTVTENVCYFSPAAVQIAGPLIDRYGGVDGAAPRRSEVALLVCNHNADRVVFAPEG
jgi:hypothetical protein